MANKALLVLRGIQGSGKSTLAESLRKHCKTNYDDVVEVSICSNDHYWEETGQQFWFEKMDQAIAHCEDEVREAVETGSQIIVIDNTSLKEEWFENFIQVANAKKTWKRGFRGYRICLVNIRAIDFTSEGEEYDSENNEHSMDPESRSAYRCAERCTKNIGTESIVSNAYEWEDLPYYPHEIDLIAPLDGEDDGVDDITEWLMEQGVLPGGHEEEEGDEEGDGDSGEETDEGKKQTKGDFESETEEEVDYESESVEEDWKKRRIEMETETETKRLRITQVKRSSDEGDEED